MEKIGTTFKHAVAHNLPFWICLGVSLFLIIGGAIVPPPFVVDSSIFVAVGELFGFAALWTLIMAIEKGVDAKVKHGDTELMVGDFNKDED